MTEDAPARLTGTIKMFDDKRGFGFIAPDDGSQDVFVHMLDCRAGGIHKPVGGMRVYYELKVAGRPLHRGPRAAYIWEIKQ